MSNIGIAQTSITGRSSSSGSSSTLNFRGAWSNVTAYSTNDVVTRKGSAYVAVSGSTGQDPYLDSSMTFWTILTQGFNFTGTWLVGTHYNYFDVVTLNNSFYLSVVAGEQSNTGNNPQTDNGTHWALLDQGFNWLSTWSSGTTYQPYDTVSYLSSSYIGLTLNNLNNPPSTSPGNWALLAQAGQVAPRQTEVFTMPAAPITQVTVSGNVVTLACVNTFVTGVGLGQINTIYISGLTGATFLNGQVLTILTNSGTQITATFVNPNYGPTADSGTATLSIPANALYFTTIPLGKTFAVMLVQCNQPNRIELYSTNTSRTNDSGRLPTVQPTAGTQHGVIMDLYLDGVQASYTSWLNSPLTYGANLQDGTVNIPATLTSIGIATNNTFSITFTYTFEEQGSGGSGSSAADLYVLGQTDLTNLPQGIANPTSYYGVDAAPDVAGSLDDEFNGTSLNTSSRWTFANQGTAVATVSKSVLTLSDSPQGSGTDIIRFIYQPTPATPYQVTTGPIRTNVFASASNPSLFNYAGGGIVIQDGATNKAIVFIIQDNSSGNGENLVIANFTDLNTYAGGSATFTTPLLFARIKYLQFKDDGTNHTFYYSEDGVNFIQVWQQSRTSYLANPSRIGLCVYPNAASSAGSSTSPPVQTIEMSYDWFRRTI